MKYFKKIFHSHSGIALITVILILSILVAAALELNRSSRSDIYNAANIGDGLKLVYMAKSGFYAAAALLADSKSEYETLRDDWAQAEKRCDCLSDSAIVQARRNHRRGSQQGRL